MKIVAITEKGREFCYELKTVHGVSNQSAERIRDALNENRQGLTDGQTWHIYEIDKYDRAYAVAQEYKFVIRNGYLCEKAPRHW